MIKPGFILRSARIWRRNNSAWEYKIRLGRDLWNYLVKIADLKKKSRPWVEKSLIKHQGYQLEEEGLSKKGWQDCEIWLYIEVYSWAK